MDKFGCEKCSKEFSSKKNLNRHLKLSCKDTLKEKKWMCYLCGKEIKYRESINRHNKSLHPDVKDKRICNKCGVFNYPANAIECSDHQPLVYRKKSSKHPKSTETGDVSGVNNQPSTSSQHTSQPQTCNSNQSQLCEKCGKSFPSLFNLKRHQSSNCHIEMCKHCSRSFPSSIKRKRHELTLCPKNPDAKSKTFICGKCNQAFKSKWEYTNHYSLAHHERNNDQRKENDATNSSSGANNDYQPWVDDEGNIDEGLRNMYERFGHVINRSHRQGNYMDEYNFRIDSGFSYETIHNNLRDIYTSNRNVFRVNITFGFILKNIEDESYRYFYAHNNEGIFPTPYTISNADDLLQLFRKIKHIDILHTIFKQRPNSKWKIHMLTNIRYVVFRMVDKSLGAGVVPPYIKNKKCIISLDINPSTKLPYTDYYCAFRCLAYHEGHRSIYNIEKTVKIYRDKWFRFKNITLKGFRGVLLSEMDEFEKLFKTNVNVLELKEDETVNCLYRTRCRFENTMYVNAFDNHLSYIKDIKRYSKTYKCRSCEKVCDTFFKWKRHERTCFNSVNYCFPGRFYSPPTELYDKLKNLGIHVDFDQFYYPYFIVYDFESYLKALEGDTNPNSNTHYTHEHVPISVSICSNVACFQEPYCIVKEGEGLLDDMFVYLMKIQKRASKDFRDKYISIFTALNEMISLLDNYITEAEENELSDNDDDDNNHISSETKESTFHEPASSQFIDALKKPNTFMSYLQNLFSDTEDNEGSDNSICSETNNIDEECDISDCSNRENTTFVDISSKFWLDLSNTNIDILKKLRKDYKKILSQLERYCDVIPVLGFNSGNYDLNLIKRKLFKFMDKYAGEASVIKKTNSYVCIQTDRLRFLDISNYLAPGCSYAQFLKAYDVKMTKSFMCYDWLTSPEKLKYPSIPPYESFYSSLKQCNVLEEEYIQYEKLENKDGISPPKTGVENYEELQRIWLENDMSTFEDFLMYYNNLDTEPFVIAVLKLLDFYKQMKIHPFKEIVSLPGISRKLLLRDISPENIFALFSSKTKDLYDLFDRNIVGGPSIVFTRYHEANVTKIRSHQFGDKSKLCQKIIGMDCNSMYLDAFRRYPMPTGHFTRRRLENNFRKETYDRYKQSYYWLSYIMFKEKKHIKHKFNGGEVVIAPFMVDGFCENTSHSNTHPRGIIYEYNGCKI